MAKLTLKSERQIQTDILAKIIAELGLNDVNKGSVLDIITQAVAQEDFAQYVAMAQISRLVNLDAITGSDLDNKAFEYGLTREEAKKAKGKIDILRPASFVKVSTTFFAGSPTPIIGDTTIDVNDASSVLIGTSGTLILGRGTSNEEEVTYSAAPVDNTNFWRFTVSALTKNHAVEETVILKQGSDETILAGTTVRVPATGTSAEIVFSTDDDIVLLAGEDKIVDVDVTAIKAGASGNIPIKAIEDEAAFSSPPFAGARAQNNSKFTTGRDRQTDNELRDAIRSHVQSLSRAVKEAIRNAIVGKIVDPVTAKRVVSANIVLPQSTNAPVKVYIDDGTGFEPSFSSQGFEPVVDSATGGETRLTLDIKPLVKAQIENNLSEPFDMSGGSKTLIYNVGTLSETVTFQLSDFQFPDTATAEEIVAAINDRATLIEARTSQDGKQVVIAAKADVNEDIQVTGGTANSILSFPTDLKSTLFLYIDDVLKSKDGDTATLDSGNSSPYNLAAIGAAPWTLTLIVDGKSANPQTITFQASDFADTTAATVAEIIAVVNEQLAGAEAIGVSNNTRVRLVSNTKLSAKSKLQVTGGTINNVTNGLNFPTSVHAGIDGDYTLNRELGTIELKNPLAANQSVSVASLFTRARLRAGFAELYAPANGQTLVISVDGGSNQTITFDNTFAAGKSAVDTAEFINSQLLGATAIVRQIGGQNYLEINTNTYDKAIGSLEIKGTSTANGAFGFTLDSVVVNQRPHKATRLSGNTGPFNFAEGDSLVVILDNDIVNNTFSIVMDYDSPVTSGASTTQFAASGLANIFQSNGELVDYYAAFLAGPNTFTGTVESVTDQAGDTWRYVFDSLPVGLANVAVGDLVKITGLSQSSNNGFFLITGVSTSGNGYIEVSNPSGIGETLQAGTALMSQRRRITAHTALSGALTVNSAFSATPVAGNGLIVLPSTVKNLVQYINNTRITSYSLKGVVEGAANNTRLQLSSQSEGSNGYIQVSGGRANEVFNFSTDILRGLQAYNYYTGLLALVHKTIYGDDQQLTSFPGVGAAGITFQILAPTVKEISVNIDVTLEEGISLASLENSIKSAITSYVNNLGVGEDVVIERIRAAVIAIRGVRDVVLNSPLVNIPTADNELARTRDALILVG